YQVRINLGHLLSDQTKLPDPSRIKLFLVAEGNWLERQDRFTCLIHWLDVLLEPRRGSRCAQVSLVIYNHADTARYRHTANSGDIGVGLSSAGADACRPALARLTNIADFDVVTPTGESGAREISEREIVAPGCIIEKRTETASRIVIAGGIKSKRKLAAGG